MSKQNIIILGFLCIGLIAYLAIKFNGKKKSGERVDFETELIDGSTFKLSELTGNYVLIDFWGSWCLPCRKENPALVKLYNKYKNQTFKDAEGFKLVTIALEKNDKTWRKAAEKDGFTWKHQIVQESKFVVMSPLARKFGVTDLPTKILIDPKGNLIGHVSLMEVEKLLKVKIE